MARPRKKVNLGEVRKNNQGYNMKLVEYDGIHNITVEFEDGYRKKTEYKYFVNGQVRNPNFKKKYNDRVGETNVNNFGSVIKIVEFNGANDIVVEFENGYKTKTTDYAFKNGSIKSPYERRTFGVGYLGEGCYKTKKNGKLTLQFRRWRGMLERCYYGERESYKDVIVCEEWHNFQNFAKWMEDNWYESNMDLQLDKDILSNEVKIYSPNTCMFIPSELNSFIASLNSKSNNKLDALGVTKKGDLYQCKVQYKSFTFLKLYKTIEEAKEKYTELKYEILFNLVHELREDNDITEDGYQKIIKSNIYNSYFEVA